MEQKLFDNGIVRFPIIVDEGVNYYPISYISERVLMRKAKVVSKHNEDKYKINTYEIDFNFVDGGVHKTKCIDEEGLRNVLSSSKLGSLDEFQRTLMNILLKHLNMPLVSENMRYLPYFDDKTISEYDQYIQDAIAEVDGEYDKWQKCSKCDCYYPLHKNFFRMNIRSSKEFNTQCRNCSGWNENRQKDSIKCKDAYSTRIYHHFGNVGYEILKSGNVVDIYEFYMNNELKTIPPMIDNKEAYIEIFNYLLDNNKLNKYKIYVRVIKNKFGLTNFDEYFTEHDLYKHIHGETYYLYPWKYSNFKFKNIKLTLDIANKVFKNYLDEYYSDGYDPLTLNYYEIAMKAGIVKIINGDSLYFAVQFNEFKYPGYMFKTQAVNYYKTESNLLFDLKYLIENDMKLEIHKIPLYLTKNTLHKKSSSLYRFIVTHNNGSLFEWIDKLYPNQFIEADFEVNPYRNEFDSDTEMFIHEILKDKFGSVIYNQRNTEHTITINGMVPDWLVFTDHGVYIVEYFGMYIPDAYETSSRIKVYIDKMNRKLAKYKSVDGYKFIYLYPSDVVDDFRGCREKLDKIATNPYVSML